MTRSTCPTTRLPTCRIAPVFAGPLVVGLLATLAAAAQSDRPAASSSTVAERGTATRTVVDPSVQPAGGAGCRECGPSGCRHCRRHHHGCRDGVCVPSCPVRPGTFGYYGTQWRRWPGQGVVPVSGTQAIMPVQPPKSAVPDADEESFAPEAGELPEPESPLAEGQSPVAPEPAVIPAEPSALEGRGGLLEPAPEAQPVEPQVKPEETPAAKPETKPADANLFDDSAARKVRRKIPVQTAGGSPTAAGGRVQVTSHTGEPGPAPAARTASAARISPRAVPRVAFDPRDAAAPRAGRQR